MEQSFSNRSGPESWARYGGINGMNIEDDEAYDEDEDLDVEYMIFVRTFPSFLSPYPEMKMLIKMHYRILEYRLVERREREAGDTKPRRTT